MPVGRRRLNLDTREVAGEPAPPPAGQSFPPVVRLSDRECALLGTLAARPSRVFSRDELRGTVFPDADNDDVVVDTYVGRRPPPDPSPTARSGCPRPRQCPRP
jgi:two-component system response regulator QseB